VKEYLEGQSKHRSLSNATSIDDMYCFIKYKEGFIWYFVRSMV
jgi:hypothetical protein